jgi:hypothetical protein
MKWVASIAFVAVVILLLPVVNDADIVIVLGLVLFFLPAPMLVLSTIDMGKTLREAPEAPRALRAVGLILSIPQALFGFVAAALGVAITLWTAYNLLVERQPQFNWWTYPLARHRTGASLGRILVDEDRIHKKTGQRTLESIVYITRMWFSENERIGFMRCTPAGYRLVGVAGWVGILGWLQFLVLVAIFILFGVTRLLRTSSTTTSRTSLPGWTATLGKPIARIAP